MKMELNAGTLMLMKQVLKAVGFNPELVTAEAVKLEAYAKQKVLLAEEILHAIDVRLMRIENRQIAIEGLLLEGMKNQGSAIAGVDPAGESGQDVVALCSLCLEYEATVDVVINGVSKKVCSKCHHTYWRN